MFDVNPNPHGGDSALEMGDIFEDSEFYRISKKEAKSIFDDMVKVVEGWVSSFEFEWENGRIKLVGRRVPSPPHLVSF